MGIRARVLDATAGRDRVRDAVKAAALGLVVIGHALAWTTTADGGVVNTLDVAPRLAPLTWTLQILPLFFLMAGAGLAGVASASAIENRIRRLAGPALPLLGIVLIGSVALQLAGQIGLARAFGLAPVQLLWFLGVYLLLIALAPCLKLIDRWWHFVLWLIAIGVVDVIRTEWMASVGWVNLVLVWGLFGALGMRLEVIRALPRLVLVVAVIVSVGFAIVLVAVGPYSSALISTEAVPGITNLAPPTMVLAAVGISQVCLLALFWPLMDRVLAHELIWVGIAVFAGRAMQVYLFHMLVFTVGIGCVLAIGWAPTPLGGAWWLLHVGVALFVIVVVWFAAPIFRSSSAALARVLGRGVGRVGAPASAGSARVWAVVAALSLLAISEAGISEPLQVRSVIGLPYLAAVPLLLVVSAVAVSARPLRAT